MKTESEILQDYTDNDETSIIVCDNFFFMLVRITGLGIAHRLDRAGLLEKLKEYPEVLSAATSDNSVVDLHAALKLLLEKEGRDVAQKLYLESMVRVDRNAAEFSDVSLYNGLPILKNHPAGNEMLSYNNLQNNPIIGTIVRAFEKDSEIWGIAKIYDLSLLESLKELQSTSPAIVSEWTFEKEHGIITAKESPIFLNHLAFVERGFWDRYSDNPSGYLNDTIKINKESSMAEAEKEKDKETEAVADNAAECVDSSEQVVPATTAESDSDKEVDVAEVVAKEADEDEGVDRAAIEAELRKELEAKIRAEIEAEYRKKAEAEAHERELEKEKQALLDSAQETALDKERWQLIARFRDIVDTAPESVGAKMPYLGNERLNPSATISKILAVNEGLYNPKYAKAIDNAYSEGTYALQKDAFENLIDTIKAKTADAYKNAKVDRSGFMPTQNPNVFVNPNF